MTRRPQAKGETIVDPTLVRIVLGLGREQEERVLRSLRFQESLANGGRYPDTPGPISRLYV